jgi:cysteine desulfurase
MANFDHAANVPKDVQVLEKYVKTAMSTFNMNSAHNLGITSKKVVCDCVNSIQHVFPMYTNVEFISGGGTMANKRILDTVPVVPVTISKGVHRDIVLISSIEHTSIHDTVATKFSRRGYTIIYIPITADGFINVEKLTDIVTEYTDRVALISILLVNNEIGTIQDFDIIVPIIRSHCSNAVIHSDVAQGIYYLTKLKNYPDVVTMSMYKIAGVHAGVLLHNDFVTLSENYTGTPDVPMIVATTEALNLYITNVSTNIKRCTQLSDIIREKLCMLFADLNIVVTDLSNVNSAPYIQSYLFPEGYQGSVLVQMLNEYSVYIGSGSACSSTKGAKGSYVLKAMGYSEAASSGSIRISFSQDTTFEHIDALIDSMKQVLIKVKTIVLNNQKPKHAKNVVLSKKIPFIEKKVLRTDTKLDVELDEIENNTLLLVYGEICLKKGNRKLFTKQLVKSIKHWLIKEDILINRKSYSIVKTSPERIMGLKERFKYMPGIARVNIGKECSGENKIDEVNRVSAKIIQNILDNTRTQTKTKTKTTDIIKFKVKSKVRDSKKWNGYSQTSLNYMFGQYIVDRFKDKVEVNLKNPDVTVYIDFIKVPVVYTDTVRGINGLPVGTEGKMLTIVTQSNICRSTYTGIKLLTRGVLVEFYCKDMDEKFIEQFRNVLHKYYKIYITTEQPDYSSYQSIVLEPNDHFPDMKNHYIKLREQQTVDKIPYITISGTNILDMKHILADSSIDINGKFTGINSGSVMLLLSGGIDSPVAAYKLLEAGLDVHFVHYTTDFDKTQNIKDIVKCLKNMFPTKIKSMHMIKFKPLQDKIKDVSDESYRTLMYKVYMLSYAEKLADKLGADFIATGNALGQVASQTPENIRVCRAITGRYIISPLYGYNKEAIIEIARNIGTYKPSTCDGTDDCCVMYLPRHPILKGKLGLVRKFMERIDESDINSLESSALLV